MSNEILIRREGAAGRVTLNRPEALNALTHGMVTALEAALSAWASDEAVRLVLIDGAGDRAFCAGGDVAELYRTGRAGDFAYGERFWRDEYRLNALIAAYPKPYIAIMDGIVMGGGVGVSAHGSHRLVTERTMMAMPECSIGLVPDVGASHLLAQAPGYLGEYLGLTGARMNASDAIHAGFADAYLPFERIPELTAQLQTSGEATDMKAFLERSPASAFEARGSEVERIFSSEGVERMCSLLNAGEEAWHRQALSQIDRSSPLSLVLTRRLIRACREEPGVRQALVREFRIVSRAMQHGDFLEGIRAAVIDKDGAPAWRYGRLSEVPEKLINTMMSPASLGDARC